VPAAGPIGRFAFQAEIAGRREAHVEDKLAALIGEFDLIPEGARAGPEWVPA
jgi:hypothetical protein